ncbi:LacI family transcriptional regulator [Desulfovibrio sp. OttesenSCG-928-I05]|nr:LacI family transcriptional regulator [Desulfovibrio sp. OttesenSCG-928-I05]
MKTTKPRPIKVTLADISKAAEVSPAAASMILNGREGVSFAEETVRRVLEAAERLNYRGPGGKRVRGANYERQTILIVTPNMLNPYYATVIQAIQQAAHAKNFDTLVYATYRDMEKEINGLHLAEKAELAGVIFTMMAFPTEVIERINRKIPVVVIGDNNSSLTVDTVDLNNFNAGALVARHLISLGHRHVAFVATPLNQSNSARVRRLEGIQAVFRDECPEGSVLVKSRAYLPFEELDNMSIEHAVGYELTRECLRDNKKVTAFMAVNDMVAYGVLDAIHTSGFTVPGDYSVSGFDNIFPSRFAKVDLTTVEHFISDKGRNAFDILYARISGAASDRNITRVEFKSHLIERGSTGAARQ